MVLFPFGGGYSGSGELKNLGPSRLDVCDWGNAGYYLLMLFLF